MIRISLSVLILHIYIGLQELHLRLFHLLGWIKSFATCLLYSFNYNTNRLAFFQLQYKQTGIQSRNHRFKPPFGHIMIPVTVLRGELFHFWFLLVVETSQVRDVRYRSEQEAWPRWYAGCGTGSILSSPWSLFRRQPRMQILHNFWLSLVFWRITGEIVSKIFNLYIDSYCTEFFREIIEVYYCIYVSTQPLHTYRMSHIVNC